VTGGMNPHLSTRFLVGTCAARDSEHRVSTAAVEGTFNRNLACGKKDRRETLIYLTHDCANAISVVLSDLVLIGSVEERVMKDQLVTSRVTCWRNVSNGHW
jgi:hypothetical protein